MDIISIKYSSYEERKALIKKKVREKIKNNPSFDSFLEEHKAKGKFIKNTTEEVLKYSSFSENISRIDNIINSKINRSNPIINSFSWVNTRQGRDYWNSLNREFIRRNNITF